MKECRSCRSFLKSILVQVVQVISENFFIVQVVQVISENCSKTCKRPIFNKGVCGEPLLPNFSIYEKKVTKNQIYMSICNLFSS